MHATGPAHYFLLNWTLRETFGCVLALPAEEDWRQLASEGKETSAPTKRPLLSGNREYSCQIIHKFYLTTGSGSFFVPKETRLEPEMREGKDRYGSQASGPRLQEHVSAVWTSILTSGGTARCIRILCAPHTCVYRTLMKSAKLNANS
jgi:hypothetical protein